MLVGGSVLTFLWAARGEVRTPLVTALMFGETILVTSFDQDFLTIDVVAAAASFVVAWGVGEVLRRLVGETSRLREEKERVLLHLRSSIARDLHDTVAQSHAIIAMRSQDLLEDDGLSSETRAELEAVVEETKQASRDLRSLLRVIREIEPEYLPGDIWQAPPLARTLAVEGQRLSEAGFAVSLEYDDRALPASVDQVLSKVVIELATNVRHHGTPGPVDIVVRQTGEAVQVRVANTSGSRRHLGGGQGLIGVDERARLLGGMSAVTCEAGSFSVLVMIPLKS